MSDYPWAYQCSICGDVVAVEEVSRHSTDEKRKPDWPGYVSWIRVERETP